MKILGFCLLLALSVSCIKTAEQVNREKRLESMSEQMQDSRGLVANMVTQMKDMQSQLDKLNGRMEELEHKSGKIDPNGITKMNENINLLSTQQQTDAGQLAQIQNELKEQRAFLEKIMTSLNNVSKSPSSGGSQKKSAKNDLAEALELVKNNEYAKARTELEALIDHNDLSPGDHNKVFHGLGRVEFYTKNYEKGLVYFSKIYSKYPKSSYAGSSLLFIARTLEKMGKKDEAKEAYAKVIEDYAGSKEAKDAKKEM
jgi:TolA-binding protein